MMCIFEQISLKLRPGWSGRNLDHISVLAGFKDDDLVLSRRIKINNHNKTYNFEIDIQARFSFHFLDILLFKWNNCL